MQCAAHHSSWSIIILEQCVENKHVPRSEGVLAKFEEGRQNHCDRRAEGDLMRNPNSKTPPCSAIDHRAGQSAGRDASCNVGSIGRNRPDTTERMSRWTCFRQAWFRSSRNSHGSDTATRHWPPYPGTPRATTPAAPAGHRAGHHAGNARCVATRKCVDVRNLLPWLNSSRC